MKYVARKPPVLNGSYWRKRPVTAVHFSPASAQLLPVEHAKYQLHVISERCKFHEKSLHNNVKQPNRLSSLLHVCAMCCTSLLVTLLVT